MKKKFLAPAAAVLLMFSAGCGKTDESSRDSLGTEPSSVAGDRL